MRRQNGFTIIELIVTILVLSIIALSVTYLLPSPTIFQTEGFSGVFLQDLRLTQILSMSSNQRYRIVIGASSYQIQDQNATPIPNSETGATSTTYPTGLSITPTTTVIFDSIGTPYNGSNVALTSVLTFNVSSGGNVKTVSVTPETGLIQ